LTVKKRLTALLLLFMLSAVSLMAQTTETSTESFMENWPIWLRDMRRWEIVAFGSFPFSMFFATMGMNMYRWYNHNGMDFNDRTHAPWPLTSTGAVAMTDAEQRRTILIAIGLSASVAIADHLIVQSRRRRDRRRAEAMPSGVIVINRTPVAVEQPEETEAGIDEEELVPDISP